MKKEPFLTFKEEIAIEAAISDVEKTTAAEIRVVVARKSAPKGIVGEEAIEAAKSRADQEFIIEGIGHTRENTGVLIFISLDERYAAVRGGKAIGKITQEEWEKYIFIILEGIKAGKPGQGITHAIREAGKMLAREFPVQPGDINEIPNHIIYKD